MIALWVRYRGRRASLSLKLEESDCRQAVWLGLMQHPDDPREGVRQALRELYGEQRATAVVPREVRRRALAVLRRERQLGRRLTDEESIAFGIRRNTVTSVQAALTHPVGI